MRAPASTAWTRGIPPAAMPTVPPWRAPPSHCVTATTRCARRGWAAMLSGSRAEAAAAPRGARWWPTCSACRWRCPPSPKAPPSAPRDAEFQRKTPLNEYGRELFAHTSAIYVNLAGRGVFDVTAAKSLLDEMKTSRDFIRTKSIFADDQERDGVLRVYDEGIRQMQQRIDAATKSAP